jgi:hypothetical protein
MMPRPGPGQGGAGATKATAAGAGCREGKLRALPWDDLGRRAGAVTIRRNLPAGITSLEEEKVPKTHAGGRTCRLSRALLADQKAHRVRQSGERLRAGAASSARRQVTRPAARSPARRAPGAAEATGG